MLLISDNSDSIRLSKFLNSDCLTTRAAGAAAREELLDRLKINTYPRGYVVLSFDGVTVCDVTFMDEAILGLQLSLRTTTEFIIMMLQDMNESILENLIAAILLRQHRGAFVPVVYKALGKYQVAGNLLPHLKETFDLIIESGHHLRASQLAEVKGLEINSASNRLRKLYDLRLVLRFDVFKMHGSPWFYYLPN